MNIINLSVPAGVSSPVAECGAVMIGYVGEGGVTQAVLDFSAWAQAYGEGVVTLGVQRSGDPTWYPVALTVDGTTAAWLVSKTDTAVEGMGVARFAYTVGGAEKRSAVWQFFVDRGLQSPEGDAPDPYESWVETLTGLGAETLQNAQDAREAAEDAAGSAESAETAKNAAGDAAAAAGESARAAGENASTAAGAAQDAQNAAGAAEQSATDAEAARQSVEDLGVTAHEDPSGPSVEKIVNPETGAVTLDFGFKPAGVTEVNGKTGEVSLDAEDVGALPDSSTLDDIPDGATYKRPTGEQLQQISDNAADIQTQSGEIDQLQADVDAIEQKIPNQASAQNQLADKAFVNSSINSAAAFFRGAFPSRAALFAVAWQTADPAAANYVSNNDYAYVADDETHNDEAWRYIYVFQPGGADNGWQPQFRVNESPLTAAQLAALNSGATAALIEQISTNAAAIALKQAIINASGILKGNGNGQVSAAAPGTDYQTPLTAGTDYATPAQVNAKYSKPGTGIPENDLASDVQSKIDNALPKTGDGSNVTAAFTAAANRTNISTGEKLSVIFGKIAKWFSDLGSAAFRAATGSITQGSTDLIESGAVYLGLATKQGTINASGMLKGDGQGGVSAATPGSDYAPPYLGVSGASAGQYLKIKTVDVSGKPTEFEGGATNYFELIKTITLTEAVNIIEVTTDDNGIPISLQAAAITVSNDANSYPNKWVKLEAYSANEHLHLTYGGVSASAAIFGIYSSPEARQVLPIFMTRIHGMSIGGMTRPNTNPGYIDGYGMRIGGELTLFEDDPWIKLVITHEYGFSAGTVIQIFGVKS